MKLIHTILMITLLSGWMVACEDTADNAEDTMERAGDNIEDAADHAGENLEDAGEELTE